jgi:hypothetical protein
VYAASSTAIDVSAAAEATARELTGSSVRGTFLVMDGGGGRAHGRGGRVETSRYRRADLIDRVSGCKHHSIADLDSDCTHVT